MFVRIERATIQLSEFSAYLGTIYSNLNTYRIILNYQRNIGVIVSDRWDGEDEDEFDKEANRDRADYDNNIV